MVVFSLFESSKWSWMPEIWSLLRSLLSPLMVEPVDELPLEVFFSRSVGFCCELAKSSSLLPVWLMMGLLVVGSTG